MSGVSFVRTTCCYVCSLDALDHWGMKHCCLVMLTRCHANGRSCVGGDAAGANLVLAQCVGGDVVGCCFCVCAVAALAKHWRAWLLRPSFVQVACVRDVNCTRLKTWVIVVAACRRAYRGSSFSLLCLSDSMCRFDACTIPWWPRPSPWMSWGSVGCRCQLLFVASLFQAVHGDRDFTQRAFARSVR